MFHVHNGTQLSMQEFENKESCLNAKAYVVKTVERKGTMGLESIDCIPKKIN
jgi:hypothetical protein